MKKVSIKIDNEDVELIPQRGENITLQTMDFYKICPDKGHPVSSHSFKIPLLWMMKAYKSVTTNGHVYSWETK